MAECAIICYRIVQWYANKCVIVIISDAAITPCHCTMAAHCISRSQLQTTGSADLKRTELPRTVVRTVVTSLAADKGHTT